MRAVAMAVSASARSIWIPGPIVEVSVILFTYLPLAAAGLAFDHRADQRLRVFGKLGPFKTRSCRSANE